MTHKPSTISRIGLTAVGLLLFTAASWAASDAALRPNPHNFTAVMHGARLFQQNCATCHGPVGQGNANWRTRGPDGKYPPPPLNGSGHMWHHPLPVLLSAIREGSIAQGGSMPAWKEKLSEAEMLDIIAWLQSKWPGQIYQRWQQTDARAGTNR